MEALSDDDFERVSDLSISDYESDLERANHETPSSTPPSSRHMRASDRKTISCTYYGCPKTFNRRARLEEHLRSHTNSRIFKCPQPGCDKDFLRDTHLKHHIKSAHSDVRDYKCTWEGCDKSFATGTRLRRHFQAHEGREKYRCRGYEGCSQTFRKHDTLRRHVLQVHEQIRPFPCNDIDLKTGRPCDKAFDTAEKLRAHQASKHDNARFSCIECVELGAHADHNISVLSNQQFGAFFATYSELQVHIAECHPPTCSYCSTACRTLKELTRHLELQHNVNDPNTSKAETFECTFMGCGRAFTKKGNLTVHIKTVHEKKREFVCGETEIAVPEGFDQSSSVGVVGCGRAFATKSSLEDHVRSAHLGMTSLQAERKRKRKAERQEGVDDELGFEKRTRKPRKDKGVKKPTILQALTGIAAPSQNTYLPLDPALGNPLAETHAGAAPVPASPEVEIKADSDDEEDDWNQLSGSMTILDGRLYHYDNQYEYSIERCPPGPCHLNTSNRQSPEVEFTAGYNRIGRDAVASVDEEPFFVGFEHEPESIRGAFSKSPGPSLNMTF